MTDNENNNYIRNDNSQHCLDEIMTNVRKIIKEAGHNELRYPELNTIITYDEMSAWINKHYKCFYSVFREDLMALIS
jgi:hypothetical protein